MNARQWWSSLATPPRPLTKNQSAATWTLAILAGISRLPALSRTLWDWDEALFTSALQQYDVTLHHPHPPGFPLFIALAKLFSLFGLSAFHSLQAVVLLAAMAIFPVIFFLGREARFTPETSVCAALLFAFLPNVWIYGGTAFSDVPSAVLAILAAALLLRGCRSNSALVWGGCILGIGIAFRPQNLLFGLAPAAIAAVHLWKHGRRRQLWMSAFLCALIVGLSYGICAYLSHGWTAYSGAVREHSAYITAIDSFHNPSRTPLPQLLDHFFFTPFVAPPINVAISALALLGLILALVRMRVSNWALLGTFGPFALLAWLYLDIWGSSRFAVAYMPLYAFLAADALWWVTPRIRYSLVGAIVLLMIVWTWPVLRELHAHPSPPIQAASWLRDHRSPDATTLWVHSSMTPLVAALLPQFRAIDTGDGGPPLTARQGDVYISEGVLKNGIVFARSRKRLEHLVRDRYFEVSIVPVERFVTFAEGWYDEEEGGGTTWRWMGNHGRVLLHALDRPGTLRLSLYVPLDALSQAPTIEIVINGSLADRFQPRSPREQRTYVVQPMHSPDQIDISTTEVIRPRDDPRLLGVRLDALEWSPAGH